MCDCVCLSVCVCSVCLCVCVCVCVCMCACVCVCVCMCVLYSIQYIQYIRMYQYTCMYICVSTCSPKIDFEESSNSNRFVVKPGVDPNLDESE